ncbi:MAG TPA: shikimate kinase [Longimicrobiales bacterium]|nr:shikimate kinase [Longimicrobiales bacterium]
MNTRRVVLIGLPGSGKSATGRMLAERLGWQFYDVDAEITAQTGLTIAELFHRDGESAFRAMEARLTAALSSEPATVIAPGGGWAAQPGQLEALPAGTAVIWLDVSPEEAIRRLRGSPEARPLLDGADPLGALRALADHRRERYALADYTVPVDGKSASAVAEIISEWLKRRTS